ncbi:mitochondrial 37S ribosomal protein mS35 Ecym_4193 [Eremothecium cymbalariae DBVPG|uniref:Small ribosomal subunit protein mS35 n=1 Tax=Eremothecium cymbalariae (strain CBS 270.75 / DBVPG 7215 / KCTC 17166 / NRRL Y-17582) TaxID=931890 RepID=G8JTB5_ERECY|nr:hypothetical protein Ecym_4193 [Eremothecium cymbalariae DBVPG\
MRPSFVHQFKASLRCFIKDGGVVAGSKAKASNKAKVSSTELYKYPSQWHGLSPEKLLQLHFERQAILGGLYKPSEEEYRALLPSAGELGISENEFKKYYYAPASQMEKELGIGDGRSTADAEPYGFDDLPSQAQVLVSQHREQRFYNRLAAYELPLLVKHRQEYNRPCPKTHPVTYRYTTYIGEKHANSRKVVLSVKTANLGLSEKELHKLRLLARTRYDHITDVLKMSSERYEEPAQNAKYLSTTLKKLIIEAKNTTDDLSDIPLDTRHTTAKNMRKKTRNHKFPEEWKRPEDAPKKTVNLIEMVADQL